MSRLGKSALQALKIRLLKAKNQPVEFRLVLRSFLEVCDPDQSFDRLSSSAAITVLMLASDSSPMLDTRKVLPFSLP